MGIGLGSVLRFLTVRAAEGFVIILLIIFMPNVPPHCKIWDSYTVTPSKPLEGKLAVNEKLNNAERWHEGVLHGPEALADYNGELYTALHTGDVVKLTNNHITPIVKFGKPCKGVHQEKICGRPLGLNFNKDGSLIVADAYYGVFKVDVKTGEKIQLISPEVEINGKKPKLPNSVVIANNGDIYWTDSTTEFILEDGLFDMLADGSGRLIHYNLKTKENNVLIDNLHFANGVALSDDDEFVLVAETARSRVLRYYLKGPKKGTSDVFIDGLPGLPDNLKSDGKGGFFIPLVMARDDDHPMITQILGPFPIIRKFVARSLGLMQFGFQLLHQIYPNEYAEIAKHFIGHFSSTSFMVPNRVSVLHVSKIGEIIDSFHATDRNITSISEVHVFKDHLYLGSPFNHYIARVPLEKVGLSSFRKQEKPTVSTQQAKSPPKQAPTKQTSTETPTTQIPTTTPPPKATPTTQAPKKQTAAPVKKETVPTKPPTVKQRVTTNKPTEAPKPSTATAAPQKETQTNKTPQPKQIKPNAQTVSEKETPPKQTSQTQPPKEKPKTEPPPKQTK